MTSDPSRFPGLLAELERRDLLPPDLLAVFVAGSVVRGWGNADSDLDVYVVHDQPVLRDRASVTRVALSPDTMQVEKVLTDGRRWDIEYWLESQVDQMFGRITWEQFDASPSPNDLVTGAEIEFLERLTYAVALHGEAWLDRRRAQLDERALRSISVARALSFTDLLMEDAAGQLNAGDTQSAVLSARMAVGMAVDALLAAHGQFGISGKWRARRFHAVAQDLITFEDYWSLETMRTFDPAAPERWIDEVLRTCRSITLRIDV